MIKVLVINIQSQGGGAEASLANLIETTTKEYFGLQIDVLSKDKCDKQSPKAAKIFSYIDFLIRIRRKGRNYDFIMAGVEGIPFILSCIAFLGLKRAPRLILWLHCVPSQYLQFLNLTNRVAVWFSISLAKNIICAAKIEAVHQKEIGRNSFFLPNVRKGSLHGSFSESTGVLPELVYIGSLAPLKQPLKTVEVLNKLIKSTHLNYKLDIYGSGVLFDELRKEINCSNLDGSVTLHGFIANPWSRILPRSILLLPSLTEATPMVVLEAIENGCIVIANRYVGSEYFERHDGLFTVVSFSDIDSVVNLIEKVLNWGPVELAERTLKSQLFIEEAFDSKVSINKLMCYLRDFKNKEN